MTEDEYILVQNLAYIKAALKALDETMAAETHTQWGISATERGKIYQQLHKIRDRMQDRIKLTES
jgi:hypothetical protein